MFLAQNLLASLPMLSDPPIPAEIPTLGSAVSAAIARRYPEPEGERYGVTRERFAQIVAAVVVRYAGNSSETEQLELVALLRIEELLLARACSAGSEAAWEEFLTRFRAPLYETAYRMAKDEATGRELADGLYAELYGIPNDNGRRISKLDYFMGRGSLEGWLRSVLSRQYVDRYRALSKDLSLEEQVEAGVSFAAGPGVDEAVDDARVAAAVAQTLAELSAEERFLLSSYYLDQRTLAGIGRELRVHESTISRKLDRLMVELHRRIRERWQAAGLSPRRCDELLQELDVRDLKVDVAANLRQESLSSSFYKKDGSVK
jgi:RNA polymerase sigma-70 factor (ECF subfamily)